MPLPPGVHFILPTLPVHVLEADAPGPTAIIQAGIHGDEVAGVHAVQELLEAGLRPARGRLLLIPVMNPGAYRARLRAAPGGLDLNRSFPGDAASPALETRLARRFLDLCIDEKPALVATLHESKKRYDPAVSPSFGQTIVYGVDPMPGIVQRTVDALNHSRLGDNEAWAPQFYPVATSSTEIIVDTVGCIGLCIETWMGFEERRRIDMQKEVVGLLLQDVGVC
jgi:uncharacterized protein